MPHIVDARDWTEWGFLRPPSASVQLIVVHRTGNPRADAQGNLHHSRSTRSWSIHHIVDSTAWVDVVPHERVAWHVKETRIAAALGFPTEFPDGSHNPRGDIAAIGVEVCENNAVPRDGGRIGQKTIPGRLDAAGEWPSLFRSPSQTKQFDTKTYDNLLDCLISLKQQYPDARIVGHGHLDPWERNTDPFGLMPRGWEGLLTDVERALSPTSTPPADTAARRPSTGDEAHALLLAKRIRALEEWKERVQNGP